MERKIGEIFNYDSVVLEVVEQRGCGGCYFDSCDGSSCFAHVNVSGSCTTSKPHGKPVIFKKADKSLVLLTKAHEELVRCGIESDIVDEIEEYLNKTK